MVSFFASTADSLLFEGDTEFSASNPQAAPLLEVSIPIGASFRDKSQGILQLEAMVMVRDWQKAKSSITQDALRVAEDKPRLVLLGENLILKMPRLKLLEEELSLVASLGEESM